MKKIFRQLFTVIGVFTVLFIIALVALMYLIDETVEIYPPGHHPDEIAERVRDRRSFLRSGDVIFQTSLSDQSWPIQKATGSPYSHVGIVYKQDSALFVLEAVQPVKLTPLDDWINKGSGNQFVAKRLEGELLSAKQSQAMVAFAQEWIGTDYDRLFDWDNELMYCSELVWKIYAEGAGIELCPLNRVKNLDLNHPEVRAFARSRFGGIEQVPNEARIVSPADLFDSELLMTVYEE